MFSKLRLLPRAFAVAAVFLAAPQVAHAAEALAGTLIADQRGHISAQMTGERSQRVKDMRVRVGDRVKKNDLLARLDTEQLEADRLIAQRALDEALAAVEVAKSNVVRAQLDYDRRAGLRNSPSFNRAAYEDAEVALRAEQSSLRNAESSTNRREAEMARIDVEIRLAEIRAPYDAVVLDVLTNVGASVTQKSPDLLTLLDLSQVEIAVPVTQEEAAHLTPGRSVAYTLADGEKRTARFRTVMPPTDPDKTALVARLEIDSADLPLSLHHQDPVQVFLER